MAATPPQGPGSVPFVRQKVLERGQKKCPEPAAFGVRRGNLSPLDQAIEEALREIARILR